MKLFLKSCLILTLGIPALNAAEVVETKETVTETAAGTTVESTTTTTFNPQARTKVVSYFDGYKTSPHGLPPAWASKVKVEAVPTAWRTTRIAPGMVVTEDQRSYLVEAPADLVSVLPAATGGVRYYIAGSNVVAVDSKFKIVDSVQIPSIKFERGTETEIETSDGKKIEVEVESDGDVEIEQED